MTKISSASTTPKKERHKTTPTSRHVTPTKPRLKKLGVASRTASGKSRRHNSGENAEPRSPAMDIDAVSSPAQTPTSVMMPLKLSFVIVGGSLGGLAAAFVLSRAGHSVQVLEKAAKLVEDAAGIRIPPNLARILERWGLGDELAQFAIKCSRLVFRKLCTGEFIGTLEYKEEVMKVLEADFWLMHYCDLLRMIYNHAVAAGAVIRFGAEVTAVDPHTPCVALSSGEVVEADLIIAADGYRSMCQQIIEKETGDLCVGEPSGTVVYSLAVNVQDISPDDSVLWNMIHQNEWTAYAGPHVSILTSPMRGYKEFSIQIFVPDVEGSEVSWERKVPIEKIDTKGFYPPLLALIKRASFAFETKFVARKIEDWVHPSAKLLLLGESAHPQIVSSTHSGSLALEDAAVLGDLFSRVRNQEQIKSFLDGYQQLRASRCWQIQDSESANSRSVMLPDGPDQEERDRSMRSAYAQDSGGWDESMFRHLWENIRVLFAYDPQEACQEWWIKWGKLGERAKEIREENEKRDRLSVRPRVGRLAAMPKSVTMMESEAEGEHAMVSETTSAIAIKMGSILPLTPPIRQDSMFSSSH